MGAGELALMISIGARDGASSVMAGIGMAASKLASGDVLGAVATAGVAAGAALVGVGASSLKAAGDFQQNMTMLSTSAGESAKNLGMVGDGVKKIAVDTGTSTEQLSKAMYLVESSGQHGADGLKVLGVAAQGAKTENADLSVVAKALTTLLTDYHMGADKATSGMNGLIKAVSNGKTTLQEMSGAMGQVLPVASSMGIKFPQVAGAISTLTNAGVPAQQAAQNLAHVLVALEAPSGVATKSMKAVGLSAQEVKDTLVNQGLPQALQLIEDHVGKKFPAGSVEAETALKNILGGLVGLKLATALTGDSLKAFQANVDSTAKAMNNAGKDVDGWDLIQQNLNFQIDRAKAAFEVLSITIGQKLLPMVTPLVKVLADLLGTFTDIISGVNSTDKAMSGLGNVSKALGDAFKFLGEIFGEVAKRLQTDDETLGFLIGIFQNLAELISGAVMGAFKAFSDFIGGVLRATFGTAKQAVDDLSNAIYSVAVIVQHVTDFFKSMQPVLSDLGKIIGAILMPAFVAVASAIKTLFIPALVGLGLALAALAAREIPGMILALLDFVHSMTAAAAASVATTGAAAASFKEMAGLIVGAIGEEVAAVAAAIGPFVLIGVAIAAVVIAFKLMYDKIQPVHDAMNAVGKVITDVAGFIGNLLKTALDAAVGAINHLGEVLGSFQKWMASSKEATNLVVAGLLGLSVAIIASLMPAIVAFLTTTLPALLAGLAAWVAELAVVVVGTLAAMGPYILIGLVVAAVIFAILEIITHWGEISTWLKQKWDEFGKWYNDMMNGIQKNDEKTRKSIQDGWNSTMKWMSDNNARNNAQTDKDWATFAKTIQKWGDASDKSIETAFNKMSQSGDKSAKDILGVFQWLYDHNHYVQRFTDFIVSSWKKSGDDVAKEDDAMRKHMVDTWTQNNQDAAKQWKDLSDIIQKNDGTTRKGLEDGWTTTSKVLSDNWDKNSQKEDQTFSDMAKSIQTWSNQSDKDIEQACNNMLKSFSQWGQNSDKAINQALSDMARSIEGFWSNQVQPALGAFGQHWNEFWSGIIQGAQKIGENIIKAIADGFKSGVNFLTNAVHSALQSALSGLGFYNIPGFAGGVTNFQPPGGGGAGFALVGENGPELIALPRGASVIPSGPSSALMSGSMNTSSASSGSDQPMIIYNILDGKQISKVVTAYQQKELHIQGNARGR